MKKDGRLPTALLRLLAIGAVAWVTLPTSAASPPLTTDAAFAQVVRAPWSRDPFPTKEEIADARSALEAAAKREPENTKWLYALAHTSRLEAAHAGEDAAEKREEAKEGFEEVVERAPTVADHNYWLGDACFDMIDDVSFFSKASLAHTGRDAFLKTVEIDPKHVAARFGLGMFYTMAPAIAGGSKEKAKAQGEALVQLADGRGKYQGRMLLADLAARDKNWAEMSSQYTAAESALTDPVDVAGAFQAHLSRLLTEKKDGTAALPVIARYRAVAKPDDTAVDFFDGEAHRLLGQYPEAITLFEKVLAKNPAARNTRFGIAECCEKLGRNAEAKKHYEEFARQFPEDDRASKAKESAKRLH